MSAESENFTLKSSTFESFKAMLQPELFGLTDQEIRLLYEHKDFEQHLLIISALSIITFQKKDKEDLRLFIETPLYQNSQKTILQELMDEPEIVFIELRRIYGQIDE